MSEWQDLTGVKGGCKEILWPLPQSTKGKCCKFCVNIVDCTGFTLCKLRICQIETGWSLNGPNLLCRSSCLSSFMIYDVIWCVDIHGKSVSVAIALVCGSFGCRLMQPMWRPPHSSRLRGSTHRQSRTALQTKDGSLPGAKNHKKRLASVATNIIKSNYIRQINLTLSDTNHKISQALNGA